MRQLREGSFTTWRLVLTFAISISLWTKHACRPSTVRPLHQVSVVSETSTNTHSANGSNNYGSIASAYSGDSQEATNSTIWHTTDRLGFVTSTSRPNRPSDTIIFGYPETTNSYSNHTDTPIQKFINVTHEAFSHCLRNGGVLNISALVGQLSFGKKGGDTHARPIQDLGRREDGNWTESGPHQTSPDPARFSPKGKSSKKLSCTVNITVPENHVVLFSLQFCSNLDVSVHEILNSKMTITLWLKTLNLTLDFLPVHKDVRQNEHAENESDSSQAHNRTKRIAAWQNFLLLNCGSWSPLSYVYSHTNTAEMNVDVKENASWDTLAFHLRFVAITGANSRRMQLQQIQTSSSTGVIQTPFWDGQKHFSPLMRSCKTITAPDDHVIFLSFQNMSISGHCSSEDGSLADLSKDEYLALFAGTCTVSSPRLWKHCNTYKPPPALHRHQRLSLQFVSDDAISATGFFGQFSFHNKTTQPRQLRGGKWNCSVPFWAEFRQHLTCDVLVQCNNGADEEFCPYTSKRCGVGNLAIGGRCYTYERPREMLPWEAARALCVNRGGILASLESAEEWDDVIGLIRQTDFYLMFIGLKTSERSVPHMYRRTWQWQSGQIAYRLDIGGLGAVPLCAGIMSPQFKHEQASTQKRITKHVLRTLYCNRPFTAFYLCEMPEYGVSPSPQSDSESGVYEKNSSSSLIISALSSSGIQSVNRAAWPLPLVACPDRHLTHAFLACDRDSACWSSLSPSSTGYRMCSAPLTPLPPSFHCANGEGTVPYNLLCDFRSDCRDSSDEEFCDHPACEASTHRKCGNSHQCFPSEELCNGDIYCATGYDEESCYHKRIIFVEVNTPPPPAAVRFDFAGKIKVLARVKPGCPSDYFQCPNNGYCFPVYARCNDIKDCPEGEDEASCDSYTCPGYYRCRSSKICVDMKSLCDGTFQCPQHDDESSCTVVCPLNCTCYGLVFFCSHTFPASQHRSLRYLEARASGLSFQDVANNTKLVHLGIGACNLRLVPTIQLRLLHSLDLSDNLLRDVSMKSFRYLRRLRSLNFAGNPLSTLTDDHNFLSRSLRSFDLSRTFLTSEIIGVVNKLPDMQLLNLSHSRVNRLEGLDSLNRLRMLDLSGCKVEEFPSGMLRGMRLLELLHASNPKLCCPANLPAHFHSHRCVAPQDNISSCDDLLRSDIYRIALTIFAVLALFGNFISFVYRLCLPPSTMRLGFHVFVTQLCVSDFLMGVYLAMVGVADRVYLGSYVWNDLAWKNSAACQIAGFLSLLSSETSAFSVCLITLERFLVICYPFSNLRFKGRSAYITSGVLWSCGLMLAATPLLPGMSQWRFYSQTGICIPLPITEAEFAGHKYSFGVMIVCNLVVFFLIAIGQALIYWSVQKQSISVMDTSSKTKDAVIARRLLTVVLSDFLCWFPIGLCGLLSSSGFSIPGEVNVALAIIVLPFNAALNPFLYTLNVMLEKRQKRQEERIKRFLLSAGKTNDLHKVA